MGVGRPSGHQFDQRIRTSAESPGWSLTIGQPAGFGDPSTFQAGFEGMKVTPDVIGWRFSSSNTMVGLP